MAVLTRDDFFTSVQTIVGDTTEENAIKFLEDMTDTYNQLEQQAQDNGSEWKQKYEELDKSWKEKYKHRFFSGKGNSAIGNNDTIVDDEEEPITIKDLFKE